MTHYAICSDDKCYSEVYTKEEMNEMLNDFLIVEDYSTETAIAEAKSRCSLNTTIDIKKDGYERVGIIGVSPTFAEGIVLEGYGFADSNTAQGAYVNVYNTTDSSKSGSVTLTVLYRKVLE